MLLSCEKVIFEFYDQKIFDLVIKRIKRIEDN